MSTVRPRMDMAALCVAGGWDYPADPTSPVCMPPKALAMYVYPIVYVEIQTRQYYRPPSQFVQVANIGDEMNHCPKAYRKAKWKAGLPTQERCSVFALDNGCMVEFRGAQMNTPHFQWALVTMEAPMFPTDNNPNQLPPYWFQFHGTLHRMCSQFLTSRPGAPVEVQTAYANADVPLYCITGNYDPDFDPHNYRPPGPSAVGPTDYYGPDDDDDDDN